MDDTVGKASQGLVCKHCGRRVAVPASTCPWCRAQIMVICASCKAYTDSDATQCQHCGAPLRADRMEGVAMLARDPVLGELAQDRERALLVASGVVANHLRDFLFTDSQGHTTVLARLFEGGSDPRTATGAILFAAYAFLVKQGYCSLDWQPEAEQLALGSLRPWAGQKTCLERMLADRSAYASTTYEASEGALRELMRFHPVAVRVRGVDGSRLHSAPERTAPAAVDHLARLTVLPPHERIEACRTTYTLLVGFVESDRLRASQLALETLRLLDWFASFQVAS